MTQMQATDELLLLFTKPGGAIVDLTFVKLLLL